MSLTENPELAFAFKEACGPDVKLFSVDAVAVDRIEFLFRYRDQPWNAISTVGVKVTDRSTAKMVGKAGGEHAKSYAISQAAKAA